MRRKALLKENESMLILILTQVFTNNFLIESDVIESAQYVQRNKEMRQPTKREAKSMRAARGDDACVVRWQRIYHQEMIFIDN